MAHIKYFKQSGASTLIMSLLLIIVMGFIVSYSSQISVTEQKISGNHYRSKQAFEAAQAGLDAVINQLNVVFVNSATANNKIGNNSSFSQAGIDLPMLSSVGENSEKVGSYSVEFKKDPINSKIVDVTVFGYAGDNQSNIPNRTISQRLIVSSLVSFKPPTPLIARGSINIGNNVSVINKTNSTNGTLPKAIWSGGDTKTDLDGTTANIDVISADGSLDGGSGIYENDNKLASLNNEEFFLNFFSESFQKLKSRATIIECSDGCTGNDLINKNGQAVGQIIWVDAANINGVPGKLNISNALTLGSTAKPVLLIVDGKIEITNSNANLNGIIYTTQNFSNGSGAGNIFGSLISAGNINASGNLSIIYEDQQLTTLQNNTSRYLRIPGSWKDF